MKKRKKKISQSQQQQIDRAHHRNEYYRRLRELFVKFDLLHVYKALDQEQLARLYDLRSQSIRVVVAPGSIVADDIIETAKTVVSHVIKNQFIPVLPDEKVSINLYDLFTVYMTLMLYVFQLNKDVKPRDKFILDALKPYYEACELVVNTASKHLSQMFSLMAYYESDLRQKIYMMRHRTLTEYEGKIGMFSFLEIHSDTPEKKNFIINGNSRPAIRLGCGEYKPELRFCYLSFAPEQLNINMQSKTLQLPVYIQSHAIQRLLERLDKILIGTIFMHVHHSLKDCLKASRDNNGNIMFEMLLDDQKVGYLLADIVQSAVVIRSFLFLTNSGTPEGDKLISLTGLDKEDKTYLEVDKLSTFLKSDIQSNEKLKNIFMQAGCGSLFHIDKTLLIPEAIKS